MGFLRASRRFSIFIFAVLRFIATYSVVSLWDGRDPQRALEIRRQLCQEYVPRLGIRIIQKGEIPQLTAIYISNHRSYIDPIIPLREILAMPVAKAEISSWPLVGFAIEMSGVLYVKREYKESRRTTRRAIAEAVRSGRSILIYPEGTTHREATTIDFHKGTFATAVAEKIPMIPMAIEFADQRHAWVGTDTFLPHFFRTFASKEIVVSICYGTPMYSDEVEDLLAQSKSWIDQNLLDMQAELGLDFFAVKV